MQVVFSACTKTQIVSQSRVAELVDIQQIYEWTAYIERAIIYGNFLPDGSFMCVKGQILFRLENEEFENGIVEIAGNDDISRIEKNPDQIGVNGIENLQNYNLQNMIVGDIKEGIDEMGMLFYFSDSNQGYRYLLISISGKTIDGREFEKFVF